MVPTLWRQVTLIFSPLMKSLTNGPETKLPPKIIYFSWIALHEACLALNNLNRRRIHVVSRCYMCQQQPESNRHLSLHCPVAADIWHMFISIFRLSWTMSHSIGEAYECAGLEWSWKIHQESLTDEPCPAHFGVSGQRGIADALKGYQLLAKLLKLSYMVI